jgi:uncharacterized membrane protein (UPF0127 family)
VKRALVIVCVLVLAASAAQGAADTRRQLVVDGKPTLKVWVLATPAERSEGVKGQPIGPGEGLWFAYDRDSSAAFWMGGVKAPLLLAWVAGNNRVIAIRRMEPCPRNDSTCPIYRPPEYFRSAIELRPGDLRRSGLKAGAVVRLRALR